MGWIVCYQRPGSLTSRNTLTVVLLKARRNGVSLCCYQGDDEFVHFTSFQVKNCLRLAGLETRRLLGEISTWEQAVRPNVPSYRGVQWGISIRNPHFGVPDFLSELFEAFWNSCAPR